MTEENNHINYSAADIEKYWKGALSAAEQHAMEKAALDDPFLADAIEGYEEKASIPQPVIAADNLELKKRLAERIAEKQSTPVIAFAWWKIAAAVVVLIGAGWLYTSLTKNKAVDQGLAKNDEIKKEAPAISKTDSIAVAPGTDTGIDTLHDVAVNKLPKPAAETKNFALKDKDSKTAAEAADEAAPVASARKPAPVFYNKQEAEDKKTDSVIVHKEDVASVTEKRRDADKFINTELNKKTQGIATDDYKANNQRLAGRANNFSNTFNGYVLDQANKPLANAFMQIPNLNVNTKTDYKGFFSFNAADTSLSVSVASAGFETQNIHLSNKAELNQIVLQPAESNQREVVVQSNGAEKRKQANEISIKILDAEPVIGWPAYNDYLKKNKKVSDDARNIHGTVLVSFEVRSKWLNSFKIEQSLDEDLDAEAIRLIREGPKWKLLKGKKANATVAVKF